MVVNMNIMYRISLFLGLIIIIAHSLFASTLVCDTQNTQLWLTPKDGVTPIIQAINDAKSRIQIVMYTLTYRKIIYALEDAEKRGVYVNIIIDKSPYQAKNVNQYAMEKLTQAGVKVRYSNPEFRFTHQKTMIIDQKTAYILTGNFTYTGFKKQRNFYIKLTNPTLVQQIEEVFQADWNRFPANFEKTALVWSPDDKGKQIMALIKDSEHSLDLYSPQISSKTILNLLIMKAKAGIDVKILVAPSGEHPYLRPLYQALRKAGAQVCYMQYPRIHGKIILSDDKIAYLGSNNLTGTSLFHNRELGVMLCNPNVVHELNNAFNQDFNCK